MYLDYFSLKEKPFSISPDPRFLFMSERYREALSHLTYGVQEGGGFVLLTGEVGTGKTTICRCLLQQLPDNTRLAFVLNPKLNSIELLATICDELKISYPENCTSLKTLTDRLNEYLLASYRNDLNVIVMIDEAQNLDTDVLEQIRLLTNLETNQKKLLQIILVGQPELQKKLAKRNLRQLAQRITARYHLTPMTLRETMAYVMHRVRIAGCNRGLFSQLAIEYLYQKTEGIPRLINTISDRALMGVAAKKLDKVNLKIIQQAAQEILGEEVQYEEKVHETNIPEQRNYEQKFSKPKSYEAAELDSTPWLKPVLLGLFLILGLGVAYWLVEGQQEALNERPKITTKKPKVFKFKETLKPKETLKSQEAVASSSIELTEVESIESETVETQKTKVIETPNLVEYLLAGQEKDTYGNNSMQDLLKLWQIDYMPLSDSSGCNFAMGYGLKCTEYSGQWEELRELNRPAILKFSAGLKGEFWVTLKSLQETQATLIVGNQEKTVSIERLSTLWSGKFILLWSVSPNYQGGIKLGDRGRAVSWLSESLNKINQPYGEEYPIVSIFDNALKRRLMDFQLSRNIQPDGIAGIRTILKINEETLSGIPLL